MQKDSICRDICNRTESDVQCAANKRRRNATHFDPPEGIYARDAKAPSALSDQSAPARGGWTPPVGRQIPPLARPGGKLGRE